LLVVPNVSAATVGTTVATLVIIAVVAAIIRWLVGVNDSAYIVADLVRRGRARRRTVCGVGAAGVVVVQVDGLAFPLLDYGIVSGVADVGPVGSLGQP
jgi:hypothetical protein